MTIAQAVAIVVPLIIAFTSLVIGLFIYIVKGAYRWAKAEERLAELVLTMQEIVKDKEEAHRLIYEMQKDDREATNKRLRWLEEHLWKNPRNPAA